MHYLALWSVASLRQPSGEGSKGWILVRGFPDFVIGYRTFIVARDNSSGQWIVADENAMLVSHDGEGALSDQMKTYLQLKFN